MKQVHRDPKKRLAIRPQCWPKSRRSTPAVSTWLANASYAWRCWSPLQWFPTKLTARGLIEVPRARPVALVSPSGMDVRRAFGRSRSSSQFGPHSPLATSGACSRRLRPQRAGLGWRGRHLIPTDRLNLDKNREVRIDHPCRHLGAGAGTASSARAAAEPCPKASCGLGPSHQFWFKQSRRRQDGRRPQSCLATAPERKRHQTDISSLIQDNIYMIGV